MDPGNFKKYALFFGLLITPYVYYFTIRKNLIKIEKAVDRKIINASQEEIDAALKKKVAKNGIDDDNEE